MSEYYVNNKNIKVTKEQHQRDEAGKQLRIAQGKKEILIKERQNIDVRKKQEYFWCEMLRLDIEEQQDSLPVYKKVSDAAVQSGYKLNGSGVDYGKDMSQSLLRDRLNKIPSYKNIYMSRNSINAYRKSDDYSIVLLKTKNIHRATVIDYVRMCLIYQGYDCDIVDLSALSSCAWDYFIPKHWAEKDSVIIHGLNIVEQGMTPDKDKLTFTHTGNAEVASHYNMVLRHLLNSRRQIVILAEGRIDKQSIPRELKNKINLI